MRKRKLANCQNGEHERPDVAKKPFRMTPNATPNVTPNANSSELNRKRTETETNSPVKKKISIEHPSSSPHHNRQSQIPRLTQQTKSPNHQIKPKTNPPPTIQDWLSIYQVMFYFKFYFKFHRFARGMKIVLF